MKAKVSSVVMLLAVSGMAWSHEGHGAASGLGHDLMHLSWLVAAILVAAGIIARVRPQRVARMKRSGIRGKVARRQ